MEIIDFHTHFFPEKMFEAIWRWFETNAWPIHYKKYADDLVAVLRSKGVRQAVSLHYPHKAGMARGLNEFTRQLAEKYPDFIIPFGSVHPDDIDLKEVLKYCFEVCRFKGIKMHSHVQQVASDDARMDPVYQMCSDYGRILLFHCGNEPHLKDRTSPGYGFDVETISGIKRFKGVLKKYPQLKIVIPHLGLGEAEEFLALLDEHPNLYFDTSFALNEYLGYKIKREWFIKHPDRFLFGTDFPHIPYEWELEKNKLLEMNLGEEINQKIFFGNAERLLHKK